jgi:hypothetical protein
MMGEAGRCVLCPKGRHGLFFIKDEPSLVRTGKLQRLSAFPESVTYCYNDIFVRNSGLRRNAVDPFNLFIISIREVNRNI